MIRCPICRDVIDQTDLVRHLHTHSSLDLFRTVWRMDWRWTLLTIALFVTGWILILVIVNQLFAN